AIPGLANRLGATIASRVALTFAEAAARFPRRVRKVVTGNPVRPEILVVSRDRAALREEAIGSLGLEPGRKTVMVFGGSQGALHLNEAIASACEKLSARADLQMLIVAGPAHAERVQGSMPGKGALRAVVLPYL